MKITDWYIATPDKLPSTYELGRRYFVESTGQIIIDFGNGAKNYGGGTSSSAKVTFIED